MNTESHGPEVRGELEALRRENQLYRDLFRDVPFGWAHHQVVLDAGGKPVDYVFLRVNRRFEEYTGLRAADITGRRVTEVIPGIERAEPDLIQQYGQVALSGQPQEIELYFAPFQRWYRVVASCPERGYFNAIFEEITARKQAEAELAATLQELARSNRDLEQFAYVASHDLQEPLRMVASYTELLGQRYQGRLDSDADRFIAYAVDGARRMQGLINDLLRFSRVGRLESPETPTDLDAVAAKVLAALADRIAQSRAQVRCEPLPRAMIHPTHAEQVLQHLLDNALKFCGEAPPRITLSGRTEGGEAIIRVADHGIGIAPAYHARVFAIFQRLHGRQDYTGSGLGLALVKRIVEHNGGQIRLESREGEGATFLVTLPAPPKGDA